MGARKLAEKLGVGTTYHLATSIEEAKDSSRTIGNGGELDLDQIAEIDGAGRMSLTENSTADLFGVNDLMQRGFCVCMDSNEENDVFVEKTVSAQSVLMNIEL